MQDLSLLLWYSPIVLFIIYFILFFIYIFIYLSSFTFTYLILSNKKPVQTRSTRAEDFAISDPESIPFEAPSTNAKATLNLSEKVGLDRPLEGSSLNHENDYYKILEFINKSKFTFTNIDNENNKGLVHKCNSNHKCAFCVNVKPSIVFIAF